MLLTTFPVILSSIALAVASNIGSQCRTDTALVNDTGVPRNFGLVLFNGFDPLDILGPSEVLFQLGRWTTLNVALISSSLDLVTSQPPVASPHNSSTWTSVKPTHTFDNPPQDLEVLIVPGGGGTRVPSNATVDFLRATYPKLKYFMTVCTGAMFAAQAGLLDEKNATTNKAAWNTVLPTGPKTNWIGEARWVVDGNIWTSSGVSAGMDAMVAFITCMFGQGAIDNVTTAMEYVPDVNATHDPFAVYPNGTYKYIHI
jgi:transcriptional regulator GlxA family with amidase domain